MEKTPFILHEKFRSDNNEQRKEHFQKKFERYIVDGPIPLFQNPAPDLASLNLRGECGMFRMDDCAQKERCKS